jgi:predicted ABC-type exoprotein transport system permease subunit
VSGGRVAVRRPPLAQRRLLLALAAFSAIATGLSFGTPLTVMAIVSLTVPPALSAARALASALPLIVTFSLALLPAAIVALTRGRTSENLTVLALLPCRAVTLARAGEYEPPSVGLTLTVQVPLLARHLASTVTLAGRLPSR